MNYFKALRKRLFFKQFEYRRIIGSGLPHTLRQTYCEGYREGWKDRAKAINVSVRFEDNNDGDSVELYPNKNGTYTIKVRQGYMCVFERTGTISEIVNWVEKLYDKN